MAKPQQATQPVSQFTPPDVEASQVAASGFAVSEVGYSMQLPRPTVMKLRHAVPERFAVCSQPIGGLVLWQRGVPPAIILARPSDPALCSCARLREPLTRFCAGLRPRRSRISFMRLLSFRGAALCRPWALPSARSASAKRSLRSALSDPSKLAARSRTRSIAVYSPLGSAAALGRRPGGSAAMVRDRSTFMRQARPPFGTDPYQ